MIRQREDLSVAANGWNSVFANFFFTGAVLYTLLFNFLSEDLRILIAGGLGVIAIARCLIFLSLPGTQFATFLFLGLTTIPLFYFVFISPDKQSAGAYFGLTLRMLAGIAMFLYYAGEAKVISPKLLQGMCVCVLLLSLFAAVTGKPIEYLGNTLPASFTGGDEGVHSSAYVVGAAFLGAITLWRLGWLSTAGLLLLGVPLLALILAYQVRTVWVMVIAFMTVTVVSYWRRRSREGLWPLLPMGMVLTILTASAISPSLEYSEFSSGRTAVYSERLELVINRPSLNVLIGTGAGSEIITSSVWWWAAKNSHNDFFDITIQIGVIGLAILGILVALSFRMLDEYQLPLFVAFIVSSMISNGLLGRPFIAALYLAFMAARRPPTPV